MCCAWERSNWAPVWGVHACKLVGLAVQVYWCCCSRWWVCSMNGEGAATELKQVAGAVG